MQEFQAIVKNQDIQCKIITHFLLYVFMIYENNFENSQNNKRLGFGKLTYYITGGVRGVLKTQQLYIPHLIIEADISNIIMLLDHISVLALFYQVYQITNISYSEYMCKLIN